MEGEADKTKEMMLYWMLTGVYEEEVHQREEWRLRPFDLFYEA